MTKDTAWSNHDKGNDRPSAMHKDVGSLVDLGIHCLCDFSSARGGHSRTDRLAVDDWYQWGWMVFVRVDLANALGRNPHCDFLGMSALGVHAALSQQLTC